MGILGSGSIHLANRYAKVRVYEASTWSFALKLIGVAFLSPYFTWNGC